MFYVCFAFYICKRSVAVFVMKLESDMVYEFAVYNKTAEYLPLEEQPF